MIRQRVLAASRAIGAEQHLRAAQCALEGPSARRNRRDDEHLRVLLAGVLRAESNCIDVGANVGAFTDEIVRLAPGGTHIAIEPLTELAAALTARHPGLEVHSCALSDESGSRTFYREEDAPARSGFRRQGETGSPGATEVSIEVRPLDELVPADREIALIKIDVEGAEEQVLRGARQTIHRCRPVIALEHGASAVANYGTTHRAIHDLLSEAGLSIFDMDGTGPLGAEEFDHIADPPGDRWNFFARPS